MANFLTSFKTADYADQKKHGGRLRTCTVREINSTFFQFFLRQESKREGIVPDEGRICNA